MNNHLTYTGSHEQLDLHEAVYWQEEFVLVLNSAGVTDDKFWKPASEALRANPPVEYTLSMDGRSMVPTRTPEGHAQHERLLNSAFLFPFWGNTTSVEPSYPGKHRSEK